MRVGFGREIRKETTWEEDKDLRNKGRIKDDIWQEAIKGTPGDGNYEMLWAWGAREESTRINKNKLCVNML